MLHRLTVVLLGAALVGCATAPPGSVPAADRRARGWGFFADPRPEADVWSRKIADWQAREQRDRPALEARPAADRLRVPEYALLWDKLDAWALGERRGLARRITAFSQDEARRHYQWDPPTDLEGDPWPSSQELFERNGDDCDGLDLIAYTLMRRFGFPEDELYRVVVRRESDGAHHMATLWFERRDDPWVIDATGAIARRMVRFSDLAGWTPLRVFDEDEQWGVTDVTLADRGR